MSRSARFVLVWTAAAALAAAGCDNRNNPAPSSPDPEALTTAATDVGLTGSLGLQAYETVVLVFPSRSPTAAPAAPDTVLQGLIDCPVVVRDAVPAAGTSLLFDYGEGCASAFDGTVSSGEILYVATPRNPDGWSLAAEFTSFAREGRTVDGVFTVSGGGLDQATVSAVGLNLSGGGQGAILNGSLVAARRPRPPGSVDPVYCSTWWVTEGSGTLDTGTVIYQFAVLDTLAFTTCCPYPVSGKLGIAAGGFLPGTVDFGNGTCDDSATLTVAGQTRTITLGFPR